MALLCDGKCDIFLCNCDECEQDHRDHIHCGCSFCHGAIVSRATAFRNRARDCQSLPSCSAADGSSGDELDEFELEPCTSETNSSVNHSMDCSINGDHVRLSESDISEHCSEESQTIPNSFLSDSRYYRKHSYNRELNSQNKNSILGWGEIPNQAQHFLMIFYNIGMNIPNFLY